MSTEPTRTAPSTAPPRAAVKPTGCCAPFDPATWPDQEITWNNQLFVKEHVHSFLHVPLDIGRKVSHAMHLIEAAHAKPAFGLMLSDELSPWSSDLYIDATGPVPGADIQGITGTFLTRVYEGPYGDARKWCDDMAAYVERKGRILKKMYLGYTACPSCAKAYGKNYVILFAQVAEVPPDAPH